jgi:TPP-dependent indolepyruvate ferredoxin oxidoreductase alpha subunit
MELYQAPELYEKVIHYDEVKEAQVRLTISTFRGIEYLSVRKYYLDFDEEWKPTKDGISMPLDFDNSRNLFVGLVEILSLAESKEIIEEHFSDLIKDLYDK